MNVAIVGSRTYPDEQRVRDYVSGLPDGTCVVSGGAYGPDVWAESQAHKLGLQVRLFLPDWDLHGRAAGPIRNELIVANSDRVVAFWDGKSKGTKSTIDIANRKGIPVEVVLP